MIGGAAVFEFRLQLYCNTKNINQLYLPLVDRLLYRPWYLPAQTHSNVLANLLPHCRWPSADDWASVGTAPFASSRQIPVPTSRLVSVTVSIVWVVLYV